MQKTKTFAVPILIVNLTSARTGKMTWTKSGMRVRCIMLHIEMYYDRAPYAAL
jgi:hypothetical protein